MRRGGPNRALWRAEPCVVAGRTVRCGGPNRALWRAEPCVVAGRAVRCGAPTVPVAAERQHGHGSRPCRRGLAIAAADSINCVERRLSGARMRATYERFRHGRHQLVRDDLSGTTKRTVRARPRRTARRRHNARVGQPQRTARRATTHGSAHHDARFGGGGSGRGEAGDGGVDALVGRGERDPDVAATGAAVERPRARPGSRGRPVPRRSPSSPRRGSPRGTATPRSGRSGSPRTAAPPSASPGGRRTARAARPRARRRRARPPSRAAAGPASAGRGSCVRRAARRPAPGHRRRRRSGSPARLERLDSECTVRMPSGDPPLTDGCSAETGCPSQAHSR